MTALRVNYDNVFRQAARLLEISEDHRRAADALDGHCHALMSTWRDPASAAYAGAAAALASDMRATAKELLILSAQIRNAAATFKEQEEANAKAARGLPTY